MMERFFNKNSGPSNITKEQAQKKLRFAEKKLNAFDLGDKNVNMGKVKKAKQKWDDALAEYKKHTTKK